MQLSEFAGATLRGGFGHIFKRTVCIWPPADCSRCLLKNTCSYPYIFETAPPPNATKLRTLDQIPRPFVIEPPEGHQRHFQPGEQFAFTLVLIGRSIEYLPYFLFTFAELGRIGLGPGRGRYEIVEVYSVGPNSTHCIFTANSGKLQACGATLTAANLEQIESRSKELIIEFLTPTRIRNEGSIRRNLDFQDLVRALLRRLSSLCFFHCSTELSIDFRSLISHSSKIKTTKSDLQWRDQQRYSGRQHQRITMGGMIGKVTFEADDPQEFAPFLPLLLAGEWVHVGKGCVMGLGKYVVERSH